MSLPVKDFLLLGSRPAWGRKLEVALSFLLDYSLVKPSALTRAADSTSE